MATRSSDLEDQTSGVNLQTRGHAGMQSQCQKGPEEMGALGSCPPTCHLGPQPGGCHPAIQIPGAA